MPAPSQMAAAYFRQYADPDLAISFSAGVDPAERLHRDAVAVMEEKGLHLSRARPRSCLQNFTGARQQTRLLSQTAGSTRVLPFARGDVSSCTFATLVARRCRIAVIAARCLESEATIRPRSRWPRVLGDVPREGGLRRERGLGSQTLKCMVLAAVAPLTDELRHKSAATSLGLFWSPAKLRVGCFLD